jgi:succinate dehydrogenase hydrophobic anchor subunit
MGLFTWASIDYNRFIKFWMIRPAQYSKPVKIVFQSFFLLVVVGGLWRIIEDLPRPRQSVNFYLSAVLISMLWMVFPAGQFA